MMTLRRHFAPVLGILVSLMTSGCHHLIEDLALRETDRESYIVQWELRTPTNWPSLKGLAVELVTNDSASKGPIGDAVVTHDGYRTYNGSFLIGRDVRRFILVEQSARTVLVYPLDIPKVGKPTDWTAWRPANVLNTSESPGWSLMNDRRERLSKESVKDIPLELRYRVKRDSYSLYDAYHKRY